MFGSVDFNGKRERERKKMYWYRTLDWRYPCGNNWLTVNWGGLVIKLGRLSWLKDVFFTLKANLSRLLNHKFWTLRNLADLRPLNHAFEYRKRYYKTWEKLGTLSTIVTTYSHRELYVCFFCLLGHHCISEDTDQLPAKKVYKVGFLHKGKFCWVLFDCALSKHSCVFCI